MPGHIIILRNTFFTNTRFFSPPPQLVIQALGILAAAQIEQSPWQARHAATLFGAQSQMLRYLMNIIPANERSEYEQAVTEVRLAMREAEFARAWVEGQAMTLD